VVQHYETCPIKGDRGVEGARLSPWFTEAAPESWKTRGTPSPPLSSDMGKKRCTDLDFNFGMSTLVLCSTIIKLPILSGIALETSDNQIQKVG
jgi:hypothetical protein